MKELIFPYPFEVKEIDPKGEYTFSIKDIDKARAFQEKYPEATIMLLGIDIANVSDASFSGDIQVTGA